MMKLWVLLFLVSCGSNSGKSSYSSSSNSQANVNPEFQPYVSAFVSHMKSSGHSLRNLDSLQMHFSRNLEDKVLGYCEQETFYENKVEVKRVSTIFINENSWHKSSFNLKDKEQLMFHELGHCLLNRDHSNEKIEALISTNLVEIPKSIMTPRHYDARAFYQKDGSINSYNYGSYIQELFNYPLSLDGLVFNSSLYELAAPELAAQMEFSNYDEPTSDLGRPIDPEHTSH